MEYDPKILSHSVWNSITSRCRWKVTLAELLLVDLSRHETWGSCLPQDPVGFFHRRFGIQLTAENGSQAVFFDPSSRMWFFQWSAQRMQQWIPKMLLKAHNKQHTHTQFSLSYPLETINHPHQNWWKPSRSCGQQLPKGRFDPVLGRVPVMTEVRLLLTGWLIGILIMVYYNPCITAMGTQNHEIWRFYTPNIWVITPKNEGFGFPWWVV